jgi:membrane protein insertase Oxa1/YidC/SpoIIIJ
LLERLFEGIYVTTGLPWWGVLATSTVAVRLLILPILVKVQRNALIIQSIRPQLNDLQTAIKVKRENKDFIGMKKKMDEMKLLLKSKNASMATSFLGIIQVRFGLFHCHRPPFLFHSTLQLKKWLNYPFQDLRHLDCFGLQIWQFQIHTLFFQYFLLFVSLLLPR